MILIVAPEDDLHAQVVSDRIRSLGHDVHIWNTTWFPWRDRISWTSHGARLSTRTADIEFADAERVWWRRFRHPTPSPLIEDPFVKDFCSSEAREVVRAVIDGAPSVVNDPRAELRAASKLLQLRSAQTVGLAVPRTVVSNDPAVLREFLSQQPEAVVKPLVGDYPHSIETRRCVPEDFADESAAALCPTLVQELVEAVADIRVCMVGDQVFPAELRRENINERVDWRMTASGWRPHRLPPEVEDGLLALKHGLELDTGSVDLRLTAGGDYVFLEINPSGQFLFLEVDAGLPVSAAYAHYLVTGAKRP